MHAAIIPVGVDCLLLTVPPCTLQSILQTPLHVACEAGHRDVASLLLERGASIDAVDVYGKQVALQW